jgi:hypothetical protein
MTKRNRAIKLRDLALLLVKARGEWREVGGSRKRFEFRTDDLTIAYRSPFQKFPPPSADVVRTAAAFDMQIPETQPHGLDIWQRTAGKVLNVEWSDKGEFVMVSYRPGSWEQKLEHLALTEL